jgi:hypothetical protein
MFDIISNSLERCSELSGDITEPVYAAFFGTNSNAQALMAHSDTYMKGRMLAQTIELLLNEDASSANDYLRWEVNNHVTAYAVHLEMYHDFLNALRATVAQCMGDEWGVQHARAWDTRIAGLLDEIHSVEPAPA